METTLAVLSFIREYRVTHPWSPTLREIADACSLAWPSSVVRHLDKLESWGFIIREPGQARSIALTDKGERFEI